MVTPLQCAVRAGDADIVRLLLGRGAEVRDEGRQVLSVLNLAEACGYMDIAALIRERRSSLVE